MRWVTRENMKADRIACPLVDHPEAVRFRLGARGRRSSQQPRVRIQQAGSNAYKNQLMINPPLAKKIAAVVIHPSTLIARLLTRSPMMRRSLVMRRIRNINGGVENPCTMPDQTRTFIGF